MTAAAHHCGLDFGTSNTTLGLAHEASGPALVPLEGRSTTIPSAVFFDFDSDEALIGRAAIAAHTAGADGRMMRALKSILGSSLGEESTRIKRRTVPFLDIIGMFVGALKARAEAASGTVLDQVVVGRPVHFVDGNGVADGEAQGQLAGAVRALGFRHVEFQYEPIAAALDYEQRVIGEELGLVVDLGGGTSDFSILRLSPTRARAADRGSDILATAGIHIGGTDFDRLLSLRAVLPELGYGTPTADGKRTLPSGPFVELATWHRINRLYTPDVLRDLRQTQREATFPERVKLLISIITHREGHRLATAVEDAKIELTKDEETALAFEGEDFRLTTRIGRTQLEVAIAERVERIEATIAEVVAAAGLRPESIETLVLTGGSTKIPAVLAMLRRVFPDSRLVATDAFGSVGLGLALEARRKFG